MHPRASLLWLALALTSATLAAQAPVDTASQSPMGDSAQPARKPPTPSTALEVTVPGQPAKSFSLNDLAALPQVTVEVLNTHSKANETYSGPLVSDLLAKAGMVLSETTQHSFLDSYVVAAGTDGYFVVLSGAELQPGLHKAQTIVAIAQAGKPLARTGAFQLVDTGDVKPARWVRNLRTLTVIPVQAP